MGVSILHRNQSKIHWVYPIFLFNRYKILFCHPKGWGKTKGIFIKVQFWDTPIHFVSIVDAVDVKCKACLHFLKRVVCTNSSVARTLKLIGCKPNQGQALTL